MVQAQTPLDYSLSEVAETIRLGQYSATELVRASLDRIGATDGTIGAFASVQGEAATARAGELDALYASPGAAIGPLHGVPIAVKDVLHTAAVETAAGSNALAGFLPSVDATSVARLRAAGAIVIGKLNTHELAFGVSCPASRNPWDINRMTGGSSGGSAAALAARQIFGALGTDTGGSVRIPSNYCGTTGIKTTRGVVPRDGMHMLSWTYDTIGPMARCAVDCRLLLEVISGYSPTDPYATRQTLPDSQPVGDLVLGVPDAGFFAGIEVDPVVGTIMDQAVDELRKSVANVQSVTVPNSAAHAESGSTIVLAEAAELQSELRNQAAQHLGEEARQLLDLGAAITGPALAAAQAVRTKLERDYLDVFIEQQVDLIIAPITPNQPLEHGIDDIDGVPLIPATTQFTMPVNAAGLPAIALPGGFAPDGLPIGFQLIGRPYAEQTLIDVGVSYQRNTDHHRRQPEI